MLFAGVLVTNEINVSSISPASHACARQPLVLTEEQ